MSANQSSPTASAPSAEELEDIILSARYGELEEIQAFVAKYGIANIADNVDERGNGCLHMAAANGHNDVLSYLLPLVPKESLAAVNNAGNTPLHWAALNGHLETLRLLVPALPRSALFLKNQFGRTPLSEAESNAPPVPEGKQSANAESAATEEEKEASAIPKSKQMECAGYLLGFMELENEKDQKKTDDGQDPKTDQQDDDGGDEEVTVGVARMGVASSTGGFEYEEKSSQ